MEPIAPTLEKLVTRSVRRATNSPVLAWPLACGSAVAGRTQAVSFAHGVLRVEVPDVGWRNELKQLAPRYLSALSRFSAENVDRIEFVVHDRRSYQ